MSDRIPYDTCPLCGCCVLPDYCTVDCSAHPLYTEGLSPEMRWKECADCGHIFTEGYFTEEACRLLFSRTNEHQQPGHNAEALRPISSRMVEKVLPFAAGGCWLDVGFGNGSLLFTAREYGFAPIGVDVRSESVDAISTLGIEAHCCTLEHLTLREPCAVVSLADVLEHMPFPRQGLQVAHRLLADSGVLFVSMPNMDCVPWILLDQEGINPYWAELEHYHNFSRDRLYRLLRQAGFEPVHYGVSERYRLGMEVVARKL
ncbi:MAG: class I SAM-dependent methyltransferase [Nevskia sp.]|nr:class I SAM-dependent methyltransferase [Nevskia sp.]